LCLELLSVGMLALCAFRLLRLQEVFKA
jgi:hypothetical protein